MNITSKRVATAFAAVIASSLLVVPALQAAAGVLPDPDTVPCEAFGSDPDCVSRRERRKLQHQCAVAAESIGHGDDDLGDDANSTGGEGSENGDVELADVIAHTNRL